MEPLASPKEMFRFDVRPEISMQFSIGFPDNSGVEVGMNLWCHMEDIEEESFDLEEKQV